MATTPVLPITILAAIDYTEHSSLVVQFAVDIARQQKAQRVDFVHVRQANVDDEAREATRAELEAWISARLEDTNGLPYTGKAVVHEEGGNPAEVIVSMASDLNASVVVVGTHGRKGLQRMLMGSVAEAVVRNAGCPVLVVRPVSHTQAAPSIEPPCPRCVEVQEQTQGAQLWCEQHDEKHGRRHTYYDGRHQTWVSQRITL
jgi:nucleotide-binding universal stress UspA family protein